MDGGNPIDDLELRGVTLYAPTEHARRARYGGASLDAAIKAALA